MALIGSQVEHTPQFHKNRESFSAVMKQLLERENAVKLGGGKDALEKQRKRGKWSARERIEKLIDPGSFFLEVGMFAAFEMYEEYGGAPSSGTIFGIGRVHDRDVVIVANDATVKAGAWFPKTCKKNLLAQEISMERAATTRRAGSAWTA